MKQKAFAGFLFVMTIALCAWLFLGIITQTENSVSYKESLSDAKLGLANYALNLTNMAQDCPYALPLRDCIDSNATTLLAIKNTPILDCKTLGAVTAGADNNSAILTITCNINELKTEKYGVRGTVTKKFEIRRG